MLEELKTAASRFHADEQWDLFARDDEIAQVQILAGPQIELEARHTNGVGVRMIANGKLATASCTGLHAAGAAIDRARAGAALCAEALFPMPESQSYAAVENYDRRLAELSVQELGEWLCSEVAAASLDRIHDPVIKATRTTRRRAIANSNGIAAEHAVTTLAVEISGSIGEGFDRLQEKLVSCRFDLSLPGLFESFLEKYTHWNGLVPASDLNGPRVVLFSENSTGALLSVLESTLKNVARSPEFGLLPKMKEELYVNPRVTITDVGDADWLPGSAPFDDEGIPKRAVKIFEGGRFVGSIHDLRTAHLLHETPTGSAVRDFDAPPSAQFSNPTVAPGTMSTGELLQSMDDGLFVAQLRNIRLSPKALGQFSAEVAAGVTVDAGKIGHSIRSLPVRGNFFHLFGPNLLTIGRPVPPSQAQGIPSFMAKDVYVGT
ncbi:MAG: metallopeptidase TldD-related protein [Thermoanaerobaculia bacterium]